MELDVITKEQSTKSIGIRLKGIPEWLLRPAVLSAGFMVTILFQTIMQPGIVQSHRATNYNQRQEKSNGGFSASPPG